MNKYKTVYEAYKQKCLKLNIKPSSFESMFGMEVSRERGNSRPNIADISKEKKASAPLLSKTALETQSTRKPKKAKT